jgi:hypothetical protein
MLNIQRMLIVAALFAALIPVSAQAAMGLKCSDWLKVRAGMRYNAETNTFVPVSGAPRIRPELDERASWAGWYVTGHVAAQMFYDLHLVKQAAAVGVTIKPINPTEMSVLYLNRVDELCRGGLQQERQDYDVAEIVDLISNGVITLRANDITTMIERAIEIGKRQGARTR